MIKSIIVIISTRECYTEIFITTHFVLLLMVTSSWEKSVYIIYNMHCALNSATNNNDDERIEQ